MRTLVQWIGTADLRAAGIVDAKPGRRQPGEKDSMGPTKTLLSQRSFDRVLLLANKNLEEARRFKEWLGVPEAELRLIPLADPTEYLKVYEGVAGVLSKLAAGTPQCELSIHLSPGTPTMTAVWVLLGKTIFPARFIATYRDKVSDVDVPFRLSLNSLPRLLKASDEKIQHLSAESPAEVEGFSAVIGDSQAIREAVGRAKRVAVRSVSVLLTGESGTGKELFAQAIHAASPRRGKPFVPINCAALPADLLEAELFGRTKGAFTGADKSAPGAFEQADGGTLFLDEVGECAPALQAKLLRVLQPTAAGSSIRRVRPVGGHEERTVDVRVIAATNRNLLERSESELFREDLYYRLATFVVRIPPLRARDGDAVRVAEAVLNRINRDFARDEPDHKPKILSPEARSFVASYAWPGNVRQMVNVLTQAAVLAESETLHRDELTDGVSERSTGFPRIPDLGDGFDIDDYLMKLEKPLLAEAMRRTGNVKAKAAKLVGLSPQTFSNRLGRHDLTEAEPG